MVLKGHFLNKWNPKLFDPLFVESKYCILRRIGRVICCSNMQQEMDRPARPRLRCAAQLLMIWYRILPSFSAHRLSLSSFRLRSGAPKGLEGYARPKLPNRWTCRKLGIQFPQRRFRALGCLRIDGQKLAAADAASKPHWSAARGKGEGERAGRAIARAHTDPSFQPCHWQPARPTNTLSSLVSSSRPPPSHQSTWENTHPHISGWLRHLSLSFDVYNRWNRSLMNVTKPDLKGAGAGGTNSLFIFTSRRRAFPTRRGHQHVSCLGCPTNPFSLEVSSNEIRKRKARSGERGQPASFFTTSGEEEKCFRASGRSDGLQSLQPTVQG